jgi:hypothetical protein
MCVERVHYSTKQWEDVGLFITIIIAQSGQKDDLSAATYAM